MLLIADPWPGAGSNVHPAIHDPWKMMLYMSHLRNSEADPPLPAESKDDLSVKLGCENGGTITKLEQQMELDGWLAIQRFQRGRQVTIMATGKSTAAPSNRAPHWRDRPEHCDVTMHLMQRYPDVYEAAIAEARRKRISLPAYVSAIVIGDLPPIANCSQASAS